MACLALVIIIFGSVLFTNQQFSFRDAGHYYYPLYKLVQREWNEGRWPLWEPEENSGMPLMGNPTAAVLYPGKIVYGLFPYPIAAKLYIVGHTIIAFMTMTLVLRGWGLSRVATTIGAISYAFGAPILFQYCNIIFLVGAAWLPLGFHGVDRWLRLGNRWGLLELAVALTLQTLGGDPQASYLLGIFAGAYALQLYWFGHGQGEIPIRDDLVRTRKETEKPGLSRLWPFAFLGVIAWVIITLVLARILPQFRGKGPPTPPLPGMRWVPYLVVLGWIGLFTLWWYRTRDGARRRLLITMMSGLIGSAALAAGLTAAQLLPVAEFTSLTSRAAEGGPHDIYPFSLEPIMLAQFVWPNIFGLHFPVNSFWIEAFEMPAFRRTVWVPSLYIGGISFILALSVFGFRNGPAWRGWMSGILIFSILGSLGLFTSPIWMTRAIDIYLNPSASKDKSSGESKAARKDSDALLGIGPLDSQNVNPIRADGYLRDGDGGFYWALSTFLPGFRQFRYPSKLLTFACFALSALAGLGWDRLLRGDRQRIRRLALGLFSLSAVLLFITLVARQPILKLFATSLGFSQWGPFEPKNGYRALLGSLTQTVVLLAAWFGIHRLIDKKPGWAGILAVILVSADLAVANSRLILSSRQELYDGVPETLRIIREAEAKDPSNAPFRIHRMPIWSPPSWHNTPSSNRGEEYTKWERDTIQPKYGITENVEYTQTMGVTELYDYEWFFAPFGRKARPEIAKILNVDVGADVVYFPRRAFDMWNTRYFIVPKFANHWTDAGRGYASFLFGNVSLVYPEQSRFEGPGGKDALIKWTEQHDYQIFRNYDYYPRAWVVHDYRPLKAVQGLNRENRQGPMTEMLYLNDPLWMDPSLKVFDPREIAWIDENEIVELQAFRAAKVPQDSERIEVRYPNPQRVEIDCNLRSPGMVVLSDIYYPGWKLTIDGKPAPIYRANRMMRGAAVPAGPHKLVYTFEPRSFRIGLILSLISILALLGFAAFLAARPVSFTVANQAT